MLQYLHVKNLALIDEIEIEFQSGLNILTGETGAGKSIILGSVNLALGGRYSGDMLRSGVQSGLVELGFTVEDAGVKKHLEELDIFVEDGMLILARKIMEGRSVSKINGETVSMGVLKEVASLLIDVHGQHEHQTLLFKKNHLALLDTYGGEKIGKLKESVGAAYKVYVKAKKALEESSLDEEARRRECALLEFEIQEIQKAALLEQEDEELEVMYRRMTKSRVYKESIAETYGYTSDNPQQNASDLLSRAIRALQTVGECDEKGEALLNQLSEVDGLLNDFNRELSEYEKNFEFSEEEYFETENRLNIINHLKTKYGKTVKEILTYCEGIKEKLNELTDYENHLAILEKQREESEELLSKYTDQLGREREKVSKIFVEEIKAGLQHLNFLDAKIELRLTKLDSFTMYGGEEGEFYISTNPGEAMKPLGAVVSGGELSRIMLAVKTALADKEDRQTLIFDEIDTGISGITAGRVAEKMHRIGETRQVICITHLPQIAAMADVHYMIQKEVVDGVTRTGISCLDKEASIKELARILGGDKVTGKILESAAEMKDMAKREI